ncbi:copia protein [Tanacetum coccineum]
MQRGKVENTTAEMLCGLDQLMERKEGGGMYLLWVPLIGDVRTLIMDEAHASRYLVHSGADKTYYDLRDMYGGHVWRRILLPMVVREDFKMGNLARLYTNEIVTRHGVHVSIISDRGGRFTSRLCLSPDPQSQENVPLADETLCRSLLMFILPTANASDKRQQSNTTPSTSTTVYADIPQLNIQTTPEHTTPEPTVTTTENIDQAENVTVDEDEFINIFGASPDGFVDQRYPDYVYRLKKALYGLKQCPKAWYDELSNFLISKDQMKYCSMVESLMYLTASKPDIVYATCYCARYQARPTEKHLKEVKRIFRYLKNTIHIGLLYPKDIGFELTTFSDLDHAGCLDTRKSTSNGIQFLRGDKVVSWSSKKQDCTSISKAEAEYVSLSTCCAQVLWMRTQLTDYGFHFDKIPMYCD